ncbi:MAG: hypothetical protein ACXW4P_23630, partial [Thermoanaerobaculia bacterium]
SCRFASQEPPSRGWHEQRQLAVAALHTLPLFPQLELVSADPLIIRNTGDATIRTRVYGAPEYRLIVKWLDGDVVVHDQWLALPKDLHPGETAEIDLPRRNADTIRLYHALQDVPMLEPEPWGTARVR